MIVKPITREVLKGLEPLLAASYGIGFDLTDELEYFPDPPQTGWFYLEDEAGMPRGYLRHFPVTRTLHVADVYVPPSPQRRPQLVMLLRSFQQHTGLAPGVALRFDVGMADTELQVALDATDTVRQTKTFLFFERLLPRPTVEPRGGITLARHDLATLAAVRDVLARLKPYELGALTELSAAEQLFVREHEGEIVSALHLEPVGETACRIVTLATAAKFEGQGHACSLLSDVLMHCARRYSRIGLLVDARNTPAVRLYRKAGFVEVPAKAECWLYTVWA